MSKKTFQCIRIHYIGDDEPVAYDAYKREDCKTACDRSAYDEAMSGQVITMGFTIAEPIWA